MFAYVNGQLISEDEAGLPVFDHGLTVGDGVFETIDVRAGVCLAPSRHLARLARSAAGLGLPPPDLRELRDALDKVVAANPEVRRGALRVTFTSGPGTVGSARGASGPSRVVAIRAMDPPEPEVAVFVVAWPRNERGALAGLKTVSYAENALALAEAGRHGAGEAIFANTVGDLCEGTGSNVFLVVGGQLVTPTLRSGCLGGITRALVIERCQLDVEERDLPVGALAEAEEAFLTSATRDIQPVPIWTSPSSTSSTSRPVGRPAEIVPSILSIAYWVPKPLVF
jgi:branched-chain amino acid aminotransferase